MLPAALFLVGRDGVHVGGVGRERHVDAGLARMVDQLLEQEVGALAAFVADDGRQGIEPLAGFLGIGVVGGGTEEGFGYCGHACLLGWFLGRARVSHKAPPFSNRKTASCNMKYTSPIPPLREPPRFARNRPADNPQMHRPTNRRRSLRAPNGWPQRLFGRWWRRQSPARQDRYATLGPLVSVLLFLAAIISAFWYLRNEELEREQARSSATPRSRSSRSACA